MSETTHSSDISVRHELLSRNSILDFAVLLAVPVVLFIIYLQPEELKRAYTFYYLEPEIVTAFSNHFIHITTAHIASNLIGYLLLASVSYVLCVLSGRRQFFYVCLITFIFVFPFVLSALNLALPRDAIGYGFSGINMALYGLLAMSLAIFVIEQINSDLQTRNAPILFFIAMGIVAFIAVPPSAVTLGTMALCVAISSYYIRSMISHTSVPTMRSVRWLLSQSPAIDVVAFSFALFVFYPFVAFPGVSQGGDAIINLYVHLLGFCLAFISAYVFEQLLHVD